MKYECECIFSLTLKKCLRDSSTTPELQREDSQTIEGVLLFDTSALCNLK